MDDFIVIQLMLIMITHLSAVTSSLQNTSLCTTLTIYTSYQDITLLLFLTILIVVNTI